MSEGSRVALSYYEESVWGTKPTAQYQYVNFEEESFKYDITKEQSKRVLSTREYAGLVTKTAVVGGGFTNPLQAGNIDAFIAAGLMDAWEDVAGGTGGGTLTAGASGSNLEFEFVIETSGGVGGTIEFGSGVTHNIVKDQFILITGSTNDANNGALLVKAVSGQIITVNTPLVTASYESLTIIAGDRVRNGSTPKSYIFEREHADVSKFFQYTGVQVNTLEFGFEPENEISLAIEFIGKQETHVSVTGSTGTPLAAPTTPEFIVGASVEGIYIDYVEISDCLIENFDLTIDNQLEPRKGVAVFGPCAVRAKPIMATGSISLYFTDFTYYDEFISDGSINFTIIMKDSEDNYYSITLPKMEFASGNANVSSLEDTVPEEHEFSCSTNGVFTVEISKI